ncbi:hypothetical protein ABEB36_001121 [Hypothenemus hampei]
MVQVVQHPNDETIAATPNDSPTSSVTDQAYRIVTSSMMADPIHQTNPVTALSLLETALTNRNVPLAKHYIDNLAELIRKDNALTILHRMGRWVHASELDRQLNFEPSAPPLVDNAQERNDDWMKQPLNRIRDRALREIDKDGDYFLKQTEFEELHYQDVLDITVRDTLRVSSELVVYSAIMRWASNECQRKGLSNEDVNMKAVLKDLIYAPRYGLMSKKEFGRRTIDDHRGPDRIGLPLEINEQILNYIKSKGKKKTINTRTELPYKMSRPRGSFDSSRSVKRHRKDEDKRPTKEKAILNCLGCFTAVFD